MNGQGKELKYMIAKKPGKTTHEVYLEPLEEMDGFWLVSEFKSIGLKRSHFDRANEMALQMRVPVSHVIGFAAQRLFDRASGGQQTVEGEPRLRQRASIEAQLLKFQDDLVDSEELKTTSAQVSGAVYVVIEKLCKHLDVSKVAFFGYAICQYWEFRKKVHVPRGHRPAKKKAAGKADE